MSEMADSSRMSVPAKSGEVVRRSPSPWRIVATITVAALGLAIGVVAGLVAGVAAGWIPFAC